MKSAYCKRFFLFAFLINCVFFSHAQVTFQTSTLTIKINNKGHIERLLSKAGVEYLAPGEPAPLMAVQVNGKVLLPVRMKSQKSNSIIVLHYPDWKGDVTIRAVNKKDYVVFELVKVQDNASVEWTAWGPYPTTIKKRIGETVGTVWDDDFGIGLQALNIKTLGGAPTSDNDIDSSFDIFQESGGLKDISPDHKVLYRSQTAKVTEYGSIIQAYSRNRNKERIIENWGHDKYVSPAYPQDGGVTGSKIALWGAPQQQLLSVIEKIELQEGLPHPTINGVWTKRSQLASSSYFIMNFGENNLEEALGFTEKAGLKYLYHPGPFETWGHFKLNNKEFPDNWQSMKHCVDIAAKRKIDLGVHTLSAFITTNDPFVTPVPDKRLAKVGSSTLTGAIDEKATTIAIASADFFNQMKNNNLKTVVIGNELIRYRDVSGSEPWTLLDCVRGAFGTTVQSHAKGDTISKLIDHGYKVFLPDISLQDDIATNIANLFNETGLKQISFDGLEGSWSTGMGQYATQLFVKKWYDLLKPELKGHVINDASGPGHYFWHIFTRMNWGEPWYAGFRESQTQYRLKNQDYFERNLMPKMLGWFKLGKSTSMEDLEWLLARAAGFNAGFALSTNIADVKKNGQGEKLLSTIREWETARMEDAFTNAQKDGLKDINKEFHLEKTADHAWKLFSVHNAILQHKQKIRQPGEPVYSELTFDNPYTEQPLRFIIQLHSTSSAEWNNPVIEINNYAKLEIPFTVSRGQIVVCDGKQVKLLDENWNTIKEADLKNIPRLSNGTNKILMDGAISGENEPSVKIELRTIGEGEEIKGNR
ncbi:MAG: hypothetical protein QM802_24550 [Agriterribacter sp.]